MLLLDIFRCLWKLELNVHLLTSALVELSEKFGCLVHLQARPPFAEAEHPKA